jgi:putative phosphotransacetylase
MDEGVLKQVIRNMILAGLARRGAYYVPVAVSARHVHLSRKDFETLFGPGVSMTRLKDLSQPGQFASEQTVEVAGPKGSFKKVRVLGPERNETQVEISVTDSFTLGLKPEIRMSGNTAGTPGCTLTGPAGTVELSRGVIVAARHVHMSEEQAAVYGVKDGDVIAVKTPAPREALVGGIVVRCGRGHDLEVHLDTDEANGNGILCGTILEAVAPHPGSAAGGTKAAAGPVVMRNYASGGSAGPAGSALDLVTERDVNNALVKGAKEIICAPGGFISPAAADRAREKHITIRRVQSSAEMKG